MYHGECFRAGGEGQVGAEDGAHNCLVAIRSDLECLYRHLLFSSLFFWGKFMQMMSNPLGTDSSRRAPVV